MKECQKINLQEPQCNRIFFQFNKDQYCNPFPVRQVLSSMRNNVFTSTKGLTHHISAW